MGKTFSEKILSLKSGVDARAGQIVTVSPDYVMSHDNSAAILKTFKKLGVEKVKYPERAVIVLDHTVPPSTETYALHHKEIREFVREQGIENFFDINTEGGICHQVLPEKGFALPGKLILGADSHTTTYGAFGAFSAGIGRSEVAAIWATGELWLRVPETIKVVVKGKVPKGVYAKDIVLHIIGKIGADGATYMAVEFTGPVVEEMTVASRMVLTNMAAEMGAKNGYVPPDEKTFEWLKGRARTEYEPIYSDPDADYRDVIEFDVSDLVPQVAAPHTVDNVRPISEVEGTPINQGLLGTCTNGRLEDLEVAARILEGRKIAPGVRALVFPASWEVYREALKKGILWKLIEAGCVIMNPGCGPCLGAHEGVLAPGEVAISTANRNFKGRMGSREAEIYLASPATVAASLIEGKITDPRKYLE
ncbi:MAG TPA: 3-isopropylmalate dehydratase large subunit [candidate division WOR-3 bacterium]|uniref:3-isopropylmalate dehydratase large subunit n=1 Tax=candidate division WOR-3 bacterium TaxID=2052148 RepID=A0A7C1BFD2_UNCW3|nr:3-isopropylmalate dehydratase large subunit [candidate division WOR-3 bacterium]